MRSRWSPGKAVLQLCVQLLSNVSGKVNRCKSICETDACRALQIKQTESRTRVLLNLGAFYAPFIVRGFIELSKLMHRVTDSLRVQRANLLLQWFI